MPIRAGIESGATRQRPTLFSTRKMYNICTNILVNLLFLHSDMRADLPSVRIRAIAAVIDGREDPYHRR